MLTREELLEILEMDSAEDFEYFEQFAELMETEEEIDFDDFYYLLSKADTDLLIEINENFFTEFEKAYPDDCDDFTEIAGNAIENLKLLVRDSEEDTYRREYVENLFKFHTLYVKKGGALVDGRECSVMEALADSRAAKLDRTVHKFEFTNVDDWQPEYISMRLGEYTGDEDEI